MLGRRRRHRLRHRRRPHGLRVRAGLHGVRRLAVRGARAEDLQGDGPGDEGGRADRRAQRLGRRAHPGGRRVAGRLRRHLPAQHAGLGRGAAAVGGPGPVRGRRGLLAGDHRLHLHGRVDQPHVHHRPRRDQHGHARGGDEGGAGRRGRARCARASRTARSPTSRRALEGLRELLSFLPQNNREDPPRLPTQRPRRSRGRGARRAGARRAVEAVRHAGAARRASSTTASSSRSSPSTRRNIVVGVRAPRRAAGRHRRQPAGAPGGLPGHRRVGEGGALRALLRLLQHPAGDLRRRARVSCPAPRRSGAASSGTAPSCCTRSPRRRCPSSRSSRARPTAAPTTSCRPSTSAATSTSRFRPAEIAVMGPEAAVNIVFRDELAQGGRSGGGARALRGRVPREVRQPVRGGVARLRRRGDPPARDARAGSAARWRRWPTSATPTRPRSTGTFRCEADRFPSPLRGRA